MIELPAIIETPLLADALGEGWDRRRAQRWLVRTGAGCRRGGRWITTPALLQKHFPEALEALTAYVLRGKLTPPSEPPPDIDDGPDVDLDDLPEELRQLAGLS